jgi:hypothetical protein
MLRPRSRSLRRFRSPGLDGWNTPTGMTRRRRPRLGERAGARRAAGRSMATLCEDAPCSAAAGAEPAGGPRRGSWYRPTAGLASSRGSHERTVLLRTLATPHPEWKRGSRDGRATGPGPMTAPRSSSSRSQRAWSPGDVVHHQLVFRDLGDHSASLPNTSDEPRLRWPSRPPIWRDSLATR